MKLAVYVQRNIRLFPMLLHRTFESIHFLVQQQPSKSTTPNLKRHPTGPTHNLKQQRIGPTPNNQKQEMNTHSNQESSTTKCNG